MYLNGGISHLEGWTLLTTKHKILFEEIKELIADLELPPQKMIRKMDDTNIYSHQYDMKLLNQQFLKALSLKNWSPDKQIRSIDGQKNDIGIGLWLGKQEFSLTDLFVMLPPIVKSKNLELVIFLVPEKSISRIGAVSFEQIYSTLSSLVPISSHYPFVILGIGPEKLSFSFHELTSPINSFLIRTIGYTLEEILSLGENSNCEFKEQLPQNKVLAQEVCSFANNKGGGVILFGVSDNGKVTGVDKKSLDSLKLRITDIIRDSCLPVPKIEFYLFDIPNGRTILTIQVYEVEQKPCLTSGRTYIRVGSSVRIATSEEIRKLILA